ncbi:hypothetical protein ACFO9Q_13815 [Paenibacillus sp. GCM10023252]|uniref:hypothetical protein n=1 Tax=Paenibacillus sp. GCM10023252 TaxID=3252649 RepID=UPI003622536F
MGITIITTAAVLTGVLTVRWRMSQGKGGEGTAACLLLLLGTVLSAALLLHVHVPNPTNMVGYVLKPIYTPINRWIYEEVSP